MCLAAGVTSTKAKFLFFSQPSLVPEYYNSGFLGPSKVLIKTHGLQTRPRHNRLRKFNSVKNSLYLQQSEQQLNSRVLINNTVILFLSRCNIIQIAQFIFKAELQKLPAYGLLSGTGSFHCSANFPVIMFLNIFINEVIRVQHGEAGEEKLEFYKQHSNSFNDLSPFRWEI